MLRPCKKRHDKPVASCHTCNLYLTDPRYRALWADGDNAQFQEVPRPAPPACDYVGDDVRASERIRLELAPNKTWKHCEHPARPLGPAVCSCMGCGPKCPGHTNRQHYLDRFREELAKPDSYPGGSGRGILTVGGGKYWPGIVVMCKLARELGITTPIEIWHRGDYEPVNASDLDGVPDVRIIDLLAMASQKHDWRPGFMPSKEQGWASKHYALTHTTLETAFFLDADAYLVSDPTPLFELAEQKRFVFWNDLPRQDKAVTWREVWPDGPNGVPPIQGGQLVIHRPSFWRELSASHWMNQNCEYYYRHMFGDQDTWRVTLAATKGTYETLGPAPWKGSAFVCAHEGKLAVVHRCQSKLFPGSQRHPDRTLPFEDRVFRILRQHFPSVLGA